MHHASILAREGICGQGGAAIHAKGAGGGVIALAGGANDGRVFYGNTVGVGLLLFDLLDQLDEHVVIVTVLLFHERPHGLGNEEQAVNVMLENFDGGFGLLRGIFRRGSLHHGLVI